MENDGDDEIWDLLFSELGKAEKLQLKILRFRLGKEVDY